MSFTRPTSTSANTAERQNAPEWLYVEGEPSLLGFRPRVSIVGTRQLTPDGGRRAAHLARELVAHDVVVVSGLARGTDTIAHETAIAGSGGTVAVLGTPLDVFCPKENELLPRKIMWEHLAVSQFAEGHPVNRTNFPRRNRTMPLVSHATVIIEAGEGSGTLSQGWEALRLGRPLFILRSITERKDLTWPREMLKYGAQVLTAVDQVLEILPPRLGSLSELAFWRSLRILPRLLAPRRLAAVDAVAEGLLRDRGPRPGPHSGRFDDRIRGRRPRKARTCRAARPAVA